LVGEDEGRRAEIKAALDNLGDPPLEIVSVTPQAGGKESSNGVAPPDVTMVVFNGNEEASLNYLQKQAERSPRPALFALVHERSPGLMRQILRAGADELLFLPLDPGDATRALLKVSESHRREEKEQGGIICSVVSTVGGVGVSSLAANLALALRYTLSKRVAQVEIDQRHPLAQETRLHSARVRAEQASLGDIFARGAQAYRGQRTGLGRNPGSGAGPDAAAV
jgi:hypothetical protein